MPIKMLYLDQPLQKVSLDSKKEEKKSKIEFFHVAFSQRYTPDDDLRQRFALMGEYGNNVVVYDTESFLIHHQIMVHGIVKSFRFANNNMDLLVVTKDCKVRFYSLMKYEGIFLREIANCHRGAITSIDVSLNSGYLLTAGADSMIKIWDYEAQKTVPYYF